MIRYTQGNLLDAEVEAVVNAVNTVGIMGKGIALMFKRKFPKNFKIYQRACQAKNVRVGRMFVTEENNLMNPYPRWIINFPTKQHWRADTQIEWIEDGLVDLARVIRENHIRSVAIPPLGCGNGGLQWEDVRPLIESELRGLEDVRIIIYEPTAQYADVTKRSGLLKPTPVLASATDGRQVSLFG